MRSYRLFGRRMITTICSTDLCAPPEMNNERYRNVNVEHKRCFSGKGEDDGSGSEKGENVDASGGVDRSKFTHEVKVKMPEVGDDSEGEYPSVDQIVCIIMYVS